MSKKRRRILVNRCMYTFWLVVLVLPGGSCSIDDEDRCSGDLIWNSDYLACQCPERTQWVGQGNECEKKSDDLASDKGANGSGISDSGIESDADTGEEKELGLAEPCQDDDDCANYKANMCLPSPAGYCTFECENPDDCKDGFQCCDCTQSELVPPGTACTKDADATLAETVGGCTCE